MNIVIPMAGRGKRTNDYSDLPKPLIEIHGRPMIDWVIETLGIDGKFIFITRRYDYYLWNTLLNTVLEDLVDDLEIIEIDYVTDGPASSALLAKDLINNDEELIIGNCDQVMDWKASGFLKKCRKKDIDGLVITQNQNNPKNSYIQLDENGYGIRLAEKEMISDHALTGVHYWKHGRDFVNSAEEMIRRDIRFNEEFYISLSYNILIGEGKNIGIYEIPMNSNWPVGTTEDIIKFKENANIKI